MGTKDVQVGVVVEQRRRLRKLLVDRFEPNLRIPGPTALPPTVREAAPTTDLASPPPTPAANPR